MTGKSQLMEGMNSLYKGWPDFDVILSFALSKNDDSSSRAQNFLHCLLRWFCPSETLSQSSNMKTIYDVLNAAVSILVTICYKYAKFSCT